MKDAYSFDRDEQGLDLNYKAMYNAYKNIFSRCGLDILITEADSGVMGGKVSHEFMVPAQDGEDLVVSCPRCKSARANKGEEVGKCQDCNVPLEKMNAIEVGHIFKLGTKYSQALEANFLDAQGKLKPMVMGCYGIGVSRLISAVIEQNNDADGIIWPKEVAPYKAVILPLDVTDKSILAMAEDTYKALTAKGIAVLLDDRDERSGVKFKDADLIGIPLQVIIGRQALKDNVLELKIRRSKEKIIAPKQEALAKIEQLI
jgi:prolyl-tRNA synthetase